jgi:hypothetical protein
VRFVNDGKLSDVRDRARLARQSARWPFAKAAVDAYRQAHS